MRTTFYTNTGIAEQERESRKAVAAALETARNLRSAKKCGLRLLERGNAKYLCAVSSDARIRWAKAYCDEFAQHFKLSREHAYPKRPLFWVTLVNVDCTTAHDEVVGDVQEIRRKLTGGLRGLSYVGVIEPAYYVSICEGANYADKRGIFWHLHCICWGKTADEMEDRFDQLNQRHDNYRPIADGMFGADYRPIPNKRLSDNSRTHLEDKFRYMLKSPRKAYRIYKVDDASIIPRFKQKQDKLRPGERIRRAVGQAAIKIIDLKED